MTRRTACIAALFSVASMIGFARGAEQARPLRIGVTLHPYFSWAKNVVGDLPGYEVRSILPGEIDAGDYQPRPDDVKKLMDLDAIVINGIGHDDFILPMLKASGNTHVTLVRLNETTPQIHAAHGSGVNSHTFISFTNAIQQTRRCQFHGCGQPFKDKSDHRFAELDRLPKITHHGTRDELPILNQQRLIQSPFVAHSSNISGRRIVA